VHQLINKDLERVVRIFNFSRESNISKNKDTCDGRLNTLMFIWTATCCG